MNRAGKCERTTQEITTSGVYGKGKKRKKKKQTLKLEKNKK